MCLFTSRTKPWVAKKDIVCYKVLKKIDHNEYRTPFLNTLVNEQVINSESPFYGSIDGPDFMLYNNVFSEKRGENYMVEEGCIHVFRNQKDALELETKLWLTHPCSYSVFKCIIPAGTEYYSGYDSSSRNRGFAAAKIIFKQEVYKL